MIGATAVSAVLFETEARLTEFVTRRGLEYTADTAVARRTGIVARAV